MNKDQLLRAWQDKLQENECYIHTVKYVKESTVCSGELSVPTMDELRILLNLLEDTMVDAIADKEVVKLVGFGKLEVKERAQRVGRNPKTGEQIVIEKREIVSFTPGKKLTDAIAKK